MLNVDEALKVIYRNDVIPIVAEKAYKVLTLYFPNINYTITNPNIVVESMSLSESICSDGDIKFGSCEGSCFKIIVANLTSDLSGQVMVVTQTVNSTYTVPLGTFIVDSCEKQNNQWFRDIVAYDYMTKVDVEVSGWYNGLTFPVTLAQFRASFLSYVGLTEVSRILPNDSMIVPKTISPASLPGRTVIEAIEEINGAFGQINRSGNFEHIVLKPAYGDYPTNDYPTNDYPISENDTSYVQPGFIDETITVPMRKSIKFEEYSVKEINKLIIRTDADDIGSIVGTGTNAYIIEGNFLVFGKSASELEIIARNAFGDMAKRPYRPYESNNIGLPYLEPGDMLKFDQSDAVMGYMFNRTLKGIQSLMDEISATGSKELEQTTSKNTQIIVLQSKMTKMKVDVDGVKINVSDLAAATATKFEQTTAAITLEATRATTAEGVLSGRIDVTAGQIALKVDAAGIIAAINISPETIKMSASKMIFEGLVTANNYFKILLDGSIEAVNGKFTGSITGSTIYLNLDSNTTAIYGVSGTSNYSLVKYATDTIYGTTTNTIVLGDTSIQSKLTGSKCIVSSTNYTYIQGMNSVMIAASSGGYYHAVSMEGLNFFPPNGDINLGKSTHYFQHTYIKNLHHGNGIFGSDTLGLFGKSPVSKTSVADLSTGASIETTVSKVQEIINVLQGYGAF